MPGDAYHEGAWAYDAAFSWDVSEEIDWLLGRLGEGTRSVLEPFCGAARMFPGFVRRGVAIAGIDLSEEMLLLARKRMGREGLPAPDVVRADAADFELGRRFDGAICPINSLAQLLSVDAAAAHLAGMARHLEPERRYLVQMDLKRPESLRLGEAPPQGVWESDDGTHHVRTRWQVEAYDDVTRTETHRCEIESLAGPRAGEVVLSRDRCRLWTWEEWEAVVAASPFEQTAAYDGDHAARPPVAVGPALEDRPLTWHELTLR
jgi:SAM-dependent methyltransferase